MGSLLFTMTSQVTVVRVLVVKSADCCCCVLGLVALRTGSTSFGDTLFVKSLCLPSRRGLDERICSRCFV